MEGPTASFSTLSGALCFGLPHNVRHGALQPLGAPSLLPAAQGGTVVAHPQEFNVAAEIGQWNVYLIINPTGAADAFLCVHNSVENPFHELQHILSVAGSPYESDCGNKCASQTTFDSGVMLINRYDWGHYDTRGDPALEDGLLDNTAVSMCILADYAASPALASYGLEHPGVVAELYELGDAHTSVGICMQLTGHEYQFGRFSLTKDRSLARSFLFFSLNTCFNTATFMGKAVKDPSYGVSFRAPPAQKVFEMFPSTRGDSTLELLFSTEDDFLTTEEASTLSGHPNMHFAPGDSGELAVELLNACACTFLTDLADSVAAFLASLPGDENFTKDKLAAFVQRLYPVEHSMPLQRFIGQVLLGEEQRLRPLPFSSQERLESFFLRQLTSTGDIYEVHTDVLAAVGNATSWLVAEVLEMAEQHVTAVSVRAVRMAIALDGELLDLFRRCALLWAE